MKGVFVKYKLYALIVLASFTTLNAEPIENPATTAPAIEETVLLPVSKEDLKKAIEITKEIVEAQEAEDTRAIETKEDTTDTE